MTAAELAQEIRDLINTYGTYETDEGGLGHLDATMDNNDVYVTTATDETFRVSVVRVS